MRALDRRARAQIQSRRPLGNGGVTLVELLVVLALFGVLGSIVGVTLSRQQRFYRGTTELLQAREGVRDALELLSTDIRGMSVADTVRLAADSAIEFFANFGSSVVCQSIANGVGLPGAAPRGGESLTAFLTQPDSGDIAVFLRGSPDGKVEWERHRIIAFGERALPPACPGPFAFASATGTDAAGKGFWLELAAPLSPEVRPGAPVRFIRRGRYSLYHASDGRWYLGYRRCNALGPSVCAGIQPLSGPYRDYSSNPRSSGILFEYFDESGQRLSPGGSPLSMARVDITARAASKQRIVVEGRSTAPADSGAVAIAIRNR